MSGIKSTSDINKYQPLVSIVTASYNRGNYIEDTIKSVILQDYPNIEYIVVDGGSTDNTIDILKRYEGRLRWISEKDEGTEDAINKGLNIARGEIFGWLNSDDTYLPGAITKIVIFLNESPEVKMVYGKGYFTDLYGNRIGNYPTEPFNLKRLAISNYICHPAAFVRKDAFREVGGYSLNLRHATDHDLWIRIAQRYKVAYLPELLATFRIHEYSKSIFEESILKGYRESLQLVMKYFNWAPASRVFTYCYHLIKSKMPARIARIRPIVLFITFIMALEEYLRLNKGIRLDDFRFIKLKDIKKLFAGWDLQDVIEKGVTL